MSEEKKATFEEAMKELETIVGKMESGSMPLDQSIEYFRKGTELIRYCDDLLNRYEKMISAVTPGVNGEPEEEAL